MGKIGKSFRQETSHESYVFRSRRILSQKLRLGLGYMCLGFRGESFVHSVTFCLAELLTRGILLAERGFRILCFALSYTKRTGRNINVCCPVILQVSYFRGMLRRHEMWSRSEVLLGPEMSSRYVQSHPGLFLSEMLFPAPRIGNVLHSYAPMFFFFFNHSYQIMQWSSELPICWSGLGHP